MCMGMRMQVLLVGDGFAVIEGLNNDAPVGCSLKFVGGAAGVLLWRRSDNLCYALLLGGGASLEVGEAVECRVRAILQARGSTPPAARWLPAIAGPRSAAQGMHWQTCAPPEQLAGMRMALCISCRARTEQQLP